MRTISKHLPYLILILILYSLISIALANTANWYHPPFASTNDLNIHVPRAMKMNDPDLFSQDPVFKAFKGYLYNEQIDQLPFPFMLSRLILLFDGIRPTLIFLSVVLGIVFILGVYGLTYDLSKNHLAGIIAALFAALNYQALGGVLLAFTPNAVLPRNFVVALSPLVFMLFFRWKSKNSLWMLYAILGLLANFHILAALHLVIVLSITLILSSKPSWSFIKRLFLSGLVSLICAAPSAISFLPNLNNVVTVTSEKSTRLLSRYAFAIRPNGFELLFFALNFLPLLIFSGIGFYWIFKLKKQAVLDRAYLILYCTVLILPWVGYTINLFTLSFTQLELLRFTRYFYLLSFVPIAILLADWMTAKRRTISLLVPIILVILIVFSRPQVATRLIFLGIHLFSPQTILAAETQDDEVQFKLEWDWNAFVELSTWVKAETPVDSLFLLPTDWSLFRIYAQRSIIVTWKGTSWAGWAEHYETVQDLYENPDPLKFIQVANDYDADYVLVKAGLDLPDLDMVYENEHYRLYQTK